MGLGHGTGTWDVTLGFVGVEVLGLKFSSALIHNSGQGRTGRTLSFIIHNFSFPYSNGM